MIVTLIHIVRMFLVRKWATKNSTISLNYGHRQYKLLNAISGAPAMIYAYGS
jgi:hypothetical protein